MNKQFGEFRWVRPPQQARSQASLERILDAASEVIAERGFAGATVAEIVRRANSSVGVFYDRFRDKDALLDCLHERFCEESYATADEALDSKRWKGASTVDVAANLIAFLVQIYRERRGLLRVFLVRCATDPKAAERGTKLMNHITEKFAALMLSHRPPIRHPDPKFAVEFALRTAYSTLDSVMIFDDVPLKPIHLDDEQLAQELSRMVLRYLGVETAEARRPIKRNAVAPL
jgi:AcrR family transcriptional regulator